MLKAWLPWTFLVKRAASAYGVADPLTLLARLRRFAQPSEVQEPIELLRAGILFHARGLINTRAIQHNLDWVWPYWVERQFNPNDVSFIPRAFSFSHVNLTHRNWTAVARPDTSIYPIVDPRGLITPTYDGWSLDFWVVTKRGEKLLPSKLDEASQHWLFGDELAVRTLCRSGDLELGSRAWLCCENASPRLRVEVSARADEPAYLVVSLRPYNPEGVQFIERITYTHSTRTLTVNDETALELQPAPERVLFSSYEHGDVLHRIGEDLKDSAVSCDVGLATAAALFSLPSSERREIALGVDLRHEQKKHSAKPCTSSRTWRMALAEAATLEVPDERIRYLYDAALHTLVLLSAEDIVPGPYTYKRFWFRDACMMLNALLALGFVDRCQRILQSFPDRQKRSGYFQSQEGEWDSNGQALWIIRRFLQATGRPLPASWREPVWRGAEWISRKRVSETREQPHTGLLPAGFSAEHFGPNDYYYWDDFWGLAGLEAAAALARQVGDRRRGDRYAAAAADFGRAIWRSIDGIPASRGQDAIPASPYRRLDAGAIGSLAADYPLQLLPPADRRIGNTAEFLLEHCFVSGAFFQDMIHSGLNPYLTLTVAQTLLRRSDLRFRDLFLRVTELASPTGQWPEAVHPFSGGGCMGDGQHGWAAAEWVMFLRNMFVREEPDRLIVGAGLLDEWLDSGQDLRLGPTQTAWGPVTVTLPRRGKDRLVDVDGDWHTEPPPIQCAVPGFEPVAIDARGGPTRLEAA